MINCIDFLKHIHDNHSKKAYGFVLRKEKKEEWDEAGDTMKSSYPLKMADFFPEAESQSYMETDDVYFSLNNFYYPKYGNARQDGNIFGINAFGMDIDYYNIPEYKNMTSSEFYLNVLKDKLLHEPNYVVDSGRGIYLIYKIEKCPKSMLAYYKAIYKHLILQYKEYGADPNATLATQILRLPGSTNSKSNTIVEILECNKVSYKITDFQDLLPYDYEDVVELNETITKELLEQPYKRPVKKATLPHEVIEGTFIVEKRLRTARNIRFVNMFLEDLKALIKYRNKIGQYEGFREQLLYHARYLMLYNDFEPTEVTQIAIQLNSMFLVPIPEKEMLQQSRPSKIQATFPKIETIMSKLYITEHEKSFLKVLTTNEHKKKRRLKQLANRKREMYFMGKTEFQFELHLKRKIVYEMHCRGMKNKEIAESLGLSAQNISNYIRYAKSHLYEFMKKLQDVIEVILGYIHNDTIVRTLTQTHYKVALEALKMGESPPD